MSAAQGLNRPEEELVDVLDDLVTYRRERFPFYRERYPDDLTITDLDDFRRLPTFRKEDVLDESGAASIVFAEGMDDAQYAVSTSGTSGTAAVSLLSKADEEAQAEKFAYLRDHYVREGEKTLVVHGLTIQRMGIWPLLESENRFYAFTHFSKVNHAAELAKQIAPECVWTSPSLAVTLGEAIDSEHCREQVQRLILTGEPLSDDRRNTLQRLFPAASHYLIYGQTETGDLGYQCEELAGTNSYHLFPEQHVYEVLEPGGTEPVEEGELVVTNTTRESCMPFTRYRTGDRVRVADDGCSCDASSVTILGRIQFDRLKVGGITVYREHFEDALATISNLVQEDYQLHIHEEERQGEVLPRLVVHLMPRPETETSDRVREDVEERIMERFMVSRDRSWADAAEKNWVLPLEVRFVDSIRTGVKSKPVVDHRSDS